MYPSIAIVNGLYPLHLGPVFCDVYNNNIIIPRLHAKQYVNGAMRDPIMSDGYKLSANSVYGKSNDKHSFMYDSVYTMKTTINGQLMLAMLCEEVVDSIETLMIQANTDGFTVKIRRSDLAEYYEICKKWEELTKLNLEYVEYEKMIIKNVNNYIAVSTEGKIKHKGSFEIVKEFHKDNSFMIVPIALSKYFVEGIPIEETIRNHTNLLDFCGRQKFKGKDYGEIHELVNSELNIEKQQKITRYYIANTGNRFIKQYAKGTEQVIHVGYSVQIYNHHDGKLATETPNIDYQFYINKCNEELRNIENTQLKLF